MTQVLKMKERPNGFLAEDRIKHDSEVFGYITELHEILWRFVYIQFPEASGSLKDWLPMALAAAEKNEAL